MTHIHGHVVGVAVDAEPVAGAHQEVEQTGEEHAGAQEDTEVATLCHVPAEGRDLVSVCLHEGCGVV